MIKKILIIALIVILPVLLFIGCEEDSGNVYFSVDWTFAPVWYDTNVPGISGTIYTNTYYLTSAGYYYFQYYHSQSLTTRTAWFTLSEAAGADRYYELNLWAYSDPDLYYYDYAPPANNGASLSDEQTRANAEGYIKLNYIEPKQ